MPSLSEEITIPSPIGVVWPLLADPALVASCIPGASLSHSEVIGVYEGSVRVKFGPTVAVFRGEARIAYHPDQLSCTIDGRGIDGRGQSRAIASGVVTASGADQTLIHVEGNFSVTGPLETFANAGGVHVARALLAEFAQNLLKLINTEGTPAPEAGAIPMVEPQTVVQQARAAVAQAPAAGGEMRGAGLLWRVFLSWLRQLFSGKGQREPR